MLLTHATVAVPDDDQAQNLIGQSAIAIENGMISWMGRSDDVPTIYRQLETLNLEGRLVTPGLIDCHTHIVHGGNRAKEFKLRLDGASYEQIANAGGGIVSTVSATREASEQELLAFALPRVDALIAEGVCTIEVKSGYGLDILTELKNADVNEQSAS
jgi:imidazolonepropionase